MRDDAAVRGELQERFTHLFVDEFQDTDPLQAEILLLLAADDPGERDWRRVRPVPGKLFLVGDPKQSIYRFRRADVALYEDVKRQLVAAGADVLAPDRSASAPCPEIQAAVNAAFAPRMDGRSPSQARYVPLVAVPAAAWPTSRRWSRCRCPRPTATSAQVVNWRIEASLPDAVAAFVDWLCARAAGRSPSGTSPTVRVPIEPRHVCLLFRRFRASGAT